MPAPFSPSPQIGASDPATPDGDSLNASIWRELLNNRRHLRGSTWGAFVWSGRLSVAGTAAAPVITVGIIEILTLRDSNNVWRPYNAATETALGIANVSGAPGSLSNSTFYYVYAWSDSTDASNLKFQITTTPPTASGATTVLRNYKRDETANYRYVGWFSTDGSGNPIAMQTSHGHSVFIDGDSVATFTNGGDTWATLDLSSRMPPHTRVARVLVRHETTSGALLRTPGQSSTVETVPTTEVTVVTSATQTIEGDIVGGPGTVNVAVREVRE